MPPQHIHLCLVQPNVTAFVQLLAQDRFHCQDITLDRGGPCKKASADVPEGILPRWPCCFHSGPWDSTNKGMSACSHLSCSGTTPRLEQTQALAWVFPFQALARSPTTCTSPRRRTHSQAPSGVLVRSSCRMLAWIHIRSFPAAILCGEGSTGSRMIFLSY